MTRRVNAVLLTALLAGLPAAMAQEAAKDPAPTVQPQVAHVPEVQLAILLDTSNSMDGLIEQAKTQIWNIVNDLALARQHGQRPHLTVALYEYGKETIPSAEGYLRQVLPLTDDLDAVSQQLFALTTNGGEEYCAQVIKAATNGLSWSSNAADLKIIVIAGNEPFTQGTIDYHKTVPEAVRKGIIVNTIFCGDRAEGTRTSWEDGAVLGEGKYSNIDQGAALPHIPAPQDDEINRLSAELNKTYIAYGTDGEVALMNQTTQDANSTKAAPAAALDRAAMKASALYTNSRWDLVDAIKDKKVKLEDVKEADLPENMKKMTPADRQAYVATMTNEREKLQKQVQDLSAARDTFVADKRKEMAAATPVTLGSALIRTIREEAERKGFEYQKK